MSMNTPIIHRGACLCNEVQFELTGDPKMCYLCHCAHCRQLTGSAFLALALVPDENLRITHGAASLRTYSGARTDSGGTLHRHFCSGCGAQLFCTNKSFGPLRAVCLGAFADPGAWTIAHEIYCDGRLPWVQPVDGAQQWPKLFSGVVQTLRSQL